MLNTDLAKEIKSYASNELKIDLIGFCSAKKDEKTAKYLRSFVSENRFASMDWLQKTESMRSDPSLLLKKAESVIVIGINYYRNKPPNSKNQGIIARYAYGRDYHKVLGSLLKKLSSFIVKLDPKSQNRICVDSAPICEKTFAVKAGLGFIGKNTTLINPVFGSFIVLGAIITSLKLPYDKPLNGTCGSCERCLKACPTKALIKDRKMDAKLCISYLTIEHKGVLPGHLKRKMGLCVFGCDICQEVCPYNKVYAKKLKNPFMKTKSIAGHFVDLDKIINMKSENDFLEKFAGSSLMRAKLKGLKRNCANAKKNIWH